ncbi:MAG: metallophosphoesterase [Bacilli bacterium]|nr:metallophosphoesterase [Bacilli bacterium]
MNELKRTLVISDIHGCYEPFNALLEEVKYSAKEDKLILIGDYVDRGPQSKEVVEQIIQMKTEGEVIVLRGNHDQRFIEIMTNKTNITDIKFIEHGGLQTLKSYCGANFRMEDINEESIANAKKFIRRNFKHHLYFLDSLPHYYEDQSYIYVHAGLNPFYKNWKNQPQKDFIWIRDSFVKVKTVVEKIVIFGHTKTIDIHSSADIWFGGDKIGIDGGCAYGLQLNCLEIKENQDCITYQVKG